MSVTSRNTLSSKKKILLGQLGRRGDCLYATAIARQIKHDYPDCHLTWAISSVYRSVIAGNPFVDAIWEVTQHSNEDQTGLWERFEGMALERKKSGEYHEVFLTQVHPGNYQNYDGTVRSSLFRGYPHPISVPIEPVVRLSDGEIKNVTRFATENTLTESDTVILFECASSSNQSYVTPEFARETANLVLKKRSGVKFVLSSDKPLDRALPNLVDGSVLAFMENAELTKYCSLLVGCSSGISWLATADWAKPIPKVQVLAEKTGIYASMMGDALYFGLSTAHVLEVYGVSTQRLANIILFILDRGFAEAKEKYQTTIPINFDFYLRQLYSGIISKGQFAKVAPALRSAQERFADDSFASKELQIAINNVLIPYFDYRWKLLNEPERTAISDVLGNLPGRLPNKARSIWGFLKLLKASCLGKNTRIARTLLKDILVRKKCPNI